MKEASHVLKFNYDKDVLVIRLAPPHPVHTRALAALIQLVVPVRALFVLVGKYQHLAQANALPAAQPGIIPHLEAAC